jgi:hypothetical protein
MGTQGIDIILGMN